MKKLLLLPIAIFLFGCTSSSDFEKGKKQLEQQGYTNIEKTGYKFFCCDKSDAFSTGFKAMAKDSSIVEGCMCSNIFKGVTIRLK